MHPKYYKSGRKPIYCAPLDGDAGGGGPLNPDSAGDAIAALLGDDDAPAEDVAAPAAEAEPAGEQDAAEAESDEQDADGAPAAAEPVTLEIDGQAITLTREQIAEAYKATQTASAETQRITQEAAEAKRQADAEKAQARQQRDQYAQKLATDTAAEQRILDDAAKQLTPELLDSDPVAYLQLERNLRERYSKLQNDQGELKKLAEQRQQEYQQDVRAYQQEQQKHLLDALPEWKDPAKAKAGAAEIHQFLKSHNYTQDEIGQIYDHRFLLMARKAMQLEQITAKAKVAAAKVATLPPKVERPGHKNVRPTDGRTVGMRRLGQTGSIEDAASLLSSML